MRVHSDKAWEIASLFSYALASETRDLAAWIDKALAEERDQCAAIAIRLHGSDGDQIASAIRNRK